MQAVEAGAASPTNFAASCASHGARGALTWPLRDWGKGGAMLASCRRKVPSLDREG